MTDEKKPRPTAIGNEADTTRDHANSTPVVRRKLPPTRCIRLMVALLNDPVKREDADRLAPASNSPHYVYILRRDFGLELPCERVPFVTIDGIPSWYGRYHATPADREMIRELLASMEAANDG